MDRAALTARYLEEVGRRGATAGGLLGELPHSELLNAFYHGRYLCRPLFIGHAEVERLYADVEMVRAVVADLAHRLYGGDFAAFASAAGASVAITSAAGACPTMTRLVRADLSADESGFHLLELNMSGAMGGADNADMCRGLLENPVLAEFADCHHLGYVDTMREQVDTIFAETGLAPGSFPVVALAYLPSAERKLGRYLTLMALRWRELGLDAHACQVGELEVRGGRVWLGGRAVDAVARMFLNADLHEPAGRAAAAPVLEAAARGQVRIFISPESEVFASKAVLAMLSDDANRAAFSAPELAVIDRLVPWTRMVRPGPVTAPDGSRADLLDYAAAHQHDLALKPAVGHAGVGVILGWDDISPPQWRSMLASARAGGYVIQQRIRPLTELFPGEEGELVPWIPVWGVFTVASGFGGIFSRAALADRGMKVINASTGASSGSCLWGRPAPGSPAAA
jgi:hypothetical protein